ncbi:ribokinase [Halobacteriales archaeon QS_1_68_20]|nr:MAG: ribokinase [Halobacteriales archaeon QS_1_68_20]
MASTDPTDDERSGSSADDQRSSPSAEEERSSPSSGPDRTVSAGDAAGTNARVAVVGSYNAGFVVEMPRFPVPGETVTGSNFEEVVGGKGSNQAVGVSRLNAHARFVGCVGDDRHADVAFDLWEREGVDAGAVQRVDAGTGVGVVFVDEDGENEIAVVPGANHTFGRDHVAAAADAIGECDVLLVQLEIDDPAVAAAVEVADERGLDVVLNPAPARELPPEVLDRVDYLTPNRTEARILAGLDPGADADDAEVAARLRDLGADTVVTTLGADGALVDDGDGRERAPAPDVDPVDTTGAGDAFNAAFAVALAEGQDAVAATEFGCAAGALSVTEFDVVPSLPARERVEELLG